MRGRKALWAIVALSIAGGSDALSGMSYALPLAPHLPLFAAIGATSNRNATLAVGHLGGRGAVIYRGSEPDALMSPAVSPNGRRVAFVENDDELAVININGSGHRILFNRPNQGLSRPVWSADGRRIFISAEGTHGRRSDVWAVPSSGTAKPTRLTATSGLTPSSVRPDGRFLAYSGSRGGRYESVGVMTVKGAHKRHVGPTNLAEPIWRPQSTTFAVFRVLRDEVGLADHITIQIQLLDGATGQYRPLAVSQPANRDGAAYPLAWTTNGAYLYYEHYDYYRDTSVQVRPRIFRVRPNGTGKTNLTPRVRGWGGDISVQPDAAG